jgi:hypothetical protein
MNFERLKQIVASPTMQAKLLGGFEGGFALGLGKDERGQWVILLDLAEPGRNESRRIELGEETVTVNVRRNFKPPHPLGLRAATR